MIDVAWLAEFVLLIYLFIRVQRIEREHRARARGVNDAVAHLADAVDRIAAKQAQLGETGVEMQRLLPPLREALQTFRKFNQTY